MSKFQFKYISMIQYTIWWYIATYQIYGYVYNIFIRLHIQQISGWKFLVENNCLKQTKEN